MMELIIFGVGLACGTGIGCLWGANSERHFWLETLKKRSEEDWADAYDRVSLDASRSKGLL